MRIQLPWVAGCLAWIVFSGAIGCRTAPIPARQQVINLNSEDLPTVLTGSFSGGAMADLLVLDKADGGRARLMRFEGGDWHWVHEAMLPRDLRFVDVVRSRNRDRFLVCRQGQIDLVNLFENTFEPVFAAAALPAPNGANSIPHVDVTRDLNGDALDDLVVPTEEGVWVALQQNDGGFDKPFLVAQPFSSAYLESSPGYRYRPWDFSRLHPIDFDRDGLNDLVYWNGHEFVVHNLEEGDGGGTVKGRFNVDAEFDTDDLTWLAAPFGVQRREKDRNPEGSMDGRVLHSIRDMDQDGVPDLVFYSLRGGGIWQLRSVIEIHYGTERPKGTLGFAKECGARLEVEGIPFRLWLRDVDDDRQVDVVLVTIKPGILKVMSLMTQWIFTGRHSMDMQCFRLKDRQYSSRPAVEYTIKASSSDSGMVFPSVLIGDVNGDGPNDLMFGLGDSLRLHTGERGGEVFAHRSLKRRLPVPRSEYSWLADLNQDGKQDVVIHDVRSNESDQLILLLSQ